MSFLEDMAGKEIGSMTNSSNPLVASVMQMINNQPGGLPGLVQRFHEKGLGGLVSSWVSTGQNLPVSEEQIQHVLGSEQVRELAAKAGISPETRQVSPGTVAADDCGQANTQRTTSAVRIVAGLGLEHAKGIGEDRHGCLVW